MQLRFGFPGQVKCGPSLERRTGAIGSSVNGVGRRGVGEEEKGAQAEEPVRRERSMCWTPQAHSGRSREG